MKRIVCYCLILSLIILGLSACAPQKPQTPQTPTADVHAVQIGDTEEQVIEKAGEPDVRHGIDKNVYCYILDKNEIEAKLFWIRDGKVGMKTRGILTASLEGPDFSEWEIDDSYVFESIERPEEISVWEPGLGMYDIIGYFGPNFAFWELESISYMTYDLGDGENLKIDFYWGAIKRVIHIQKDGTETILWKFDGYTY